MLEISLNGIQLSRKSENLSLYNNKHIILRFKMLPSCISGKKRKRKFAIPCPIPETAQKLSSTSHDDSHKPCHLS